MNPTPLTPELHATAPEIARRFTTIMASIIAVARQQISEHSPP